METEIDFTACPHVPGRAYNGANGKKVAIRFENDARIKVFPASAIKIGDRKINYVEFIRNRANPGLNAAISRIVPRIDIRAICAFIRGVPYLTDLQRDFYCHYLTTRNRALFA